MTPASHWLRVGPGSFEELRGLPLTDRGFRYGMAIFETIGVHRGRVAFQPEHLQSAFEAASNSGLAIEREWLDEAGDFLAAKLVPDYSGIARIHVTAGDGAPGQPMDHCRIIVTFEERMPLPEIAFDTGYNLRDFPEPFFPQLGGRKTHNYWRNIEAFSFAQAQNADEALLFNVDGLLISASMANVFVISAEGRISTPSLALSPRNGIVRWWVINHYDVHEANISRNEVAAAAEIFLTNSWIGIMPVATLSSLQLKMTVSKCVSAHFRRTLEG